MPYLRSHVPRALLALAISAFAIGTTEFVIMGLLPEVAGDLSVSIPKAGLLISAYALGVAIGAPILAILSSRWRRKTALLVLMGLFIAGNLLSALAPDYCVLMLARVIAALCHGAFFGIGAVVAADLVANNQRARAVALMFTGLTLANVLGVPLGTLIGHSLGWRATFWCVTALGVLSAVALIRWVPSHLRSGITHITTELQVLGKLKVWLALGMTVLGFGGVFTVFTYIAPILQELAHASPSMVSTVLLLFGLGLTLGNVLGGRLADWYLMPSLMGTLAALAIVLVLFAWTSHSLVPAALTVFAWGVIAFSCVAPLQMHVVEQARSAPNLASTLNISAFNLGNAGGAWLGGEVINRELTLDHIMYTGAAVAFAGLLLTVICHVLEKRSRICMSASPT
ncbi:MFS transporter [Uliginosibacterium gangwonense]|uniref:MFS transporter n=1 Tax=Uliginosibacterium gangwonense TaxID=392736 RepID=UPI0003741BF6|nr:MFS transporter [Uliginosibacterium gangwonense]